jgi:hypothetical protein
VLVIDCRSYRYHVCDYVVVPSLGRIGARHCNEDATVHDLDGTKKDYCDRHARIVRGASGATNGKVSPS